MRHIVEPDGTKPYYVYVLAYPEGYEENGVDLSGVVFYVGKGELQKGQSLRDRIDDHERESELGVQSPKCEAIRKIRNARRDLSARRGTEYRCSPRGSG